MAIYLFEIAVILIMGWFTEGSKVKVCYGQKNLNKGLFLIISFSMMALTLGLRGPKVGEDTQHFMNVFNSVQNLSWDKVVTSNVNVIYNTVYDVDLAMEAGYILLNKLVGMFTNDAHVLIFIVAVITCLFFAKFINDNFENPFFPTYIFMCESLYMNSFNAVRQMLALSIGIQAYTALKRNRGGGGYARAIIYVMIAFLFHMSAIVLLALIPLWMIKKEQKAVKYIFIASAALPFLIPIVTAVVSHFIPRWSAYFATNYWGADIGGIIVLWTLEIIICGIIYIRGLRNDKETFVTVSCTLFYLSIEMIGLNLTMFSRIALWFRPFLMCLFSIFPKYLKGRTKIVYKVGILLLLALLYISYARTDTRTYQFFWK